MNVNPHRVPGAQRAEAIKDEARAHIRDVRASRRLSPTGKAQEIRRIHAETQASLAALRTETERAPRQRRDLIESLLFGGATPLSGPDAVSARDAYMRASQAADRTEAVHLMEMAKLSFDTVLAKAVAQAAVKHEWTDVLETYAGGDTHLEQQFTELLQLNADLAETGTETTRMAADMEKQLVFTLEQPDELAYPVPTEPAETASAPATGQREGAWA